MQWPRRNARECQRVSWVPELSRVFGLTFASQVNTHRKQEQVGLWPQRNSVSTIAKKSHNGQLLLQAAGYGNAASLELLLGDDQLDPNIKNSNGCTPLLLAVLGSKARKNWAAPERKYELVARLLLAHGQVNPNCQDSKGRTPLSHAAERGYSSLIEQILKHKDIEPNRADKAGRTPLSRAAAAGHVQAVSRLIKHGLIPDSKDETGRTPLSWAVKCFVPGPFGSIKNEQCEIVELLLGLDNIDPNICDNDGRTPLAWAITYLPKEQVKLPTAFQNLLDRSSESLSSKDSHGRTLLSRAAEIGNETVITQLLEKKINPDIKDDDDRTPLSQAAAMGHLPVVSLLLRHFVDPDSRDKADRTPLWWAAKGGHEAVVKSLLVKKVNPDLMDEDRCTPLLCAVKNQRVAATIQLLIKRDKFTLHILAQDGDLIPLEFLLKQGSKVDGRNIDGRTPLHIAARSGHVAIAQKLICNKADINCKDTDGKTPLVLALESKHHSLVELLLKHSAQTTDIMSGQWLDAYGKGHSEVVVNLSQSSCGKQSVLFVKAPQLNTLCNMGPARRLL